MWFGSEVFEEKVQDFLEIKFVMKHQEKVTIVVVLQVQFYYLEHKARDQFQLIQIHDLQLLVSSTQYPFLHDAQIRMQKVIQVQDVQVQFQVLIQFQVQVQDYY